MKAATSNLQGLLYNQNVHSVADLYTFYFAAGAQRWTSADVDIVVGTDTYSSTGPRLERGTLSTAEGFEVSTLDIRIYPGAAQVGGKPLMQAALAGLFDGVRVLVQRAYMTTWGTAAAEYVLPVFDGEIAEVEPASTEMVLTVKSVLYKLNQQIPRRILQPSCPYRFGSPECGISLANYTTTAQVAAGSTASVLRVSKTAADNFYRLGTVTFGDGQVRSIVASQDVGGGVHTLTLDMPVSPVPAQGASVTVTRSCEFSRTSCVNFGNVNRFGGFPEVPKSEVT